MTLPEVAIFATIVTALFYAFFILRLPQRRTWSIELTQFISPVLRRLQWCIIFHFCFLYNDLPVKRGPCPALADMPRASA
jgi:hypothetical protein